MSRLVGNKLPEELYRRLSSGNLSLHKEKAIVVCSVDVNGWPHPAILSYFEVIAKDERNLRLAIYKSTTTVKNILRSGKLALQIIDQRLAYYIKGTAEVLTYEMNCSPQNSKLNLRIEQVLADEANEEFEPGGYITSGITYRRATNSVETDAILQELLA